MAARRDPLTGNQPQLIIVACASGLVAALSQASPTGITVVDAALVCAVAGFVTWAAATAPWGVIVGAAGIAAAFAANVVLLGIALVAGAAVFFIGVRKQDLPLVRIVAAGATVQVLFRLGSIRFLGLSAIIAGVTLAILAIAGLRRRPPAHRTSMWRALGAVAGFAVIALVGLVLTGLSSRAPLQEAARHAEAGLDLLNAGDIPGASAAFAESADAFRDASDHLTAVWTQPSRLLPVVSQNRQAAVDLATEGASAMRTAADALGLVDPETLRVVNGAIDVQAIRDLAAPFTEMAASVDSIQDVLAGLDSPWLAGPLTERLDDLSADLTKNRQRVDNVVMATELAPGMLGADGIRRYFIAFTTPAAARGLGGVLASWAELSIDNGRLSITDFGRHTDLSAGGPEPDARVITGPPEFLDRWGSFGFLEPDGTTGPTPWTSITMPPDFPMVADVIAELYPQSGGRAIDGVFALDTSALAALVSITGPPDVDGLGLELTAANLARFLLQDQYVIGDGTERVDLLDVVASSALSRILTSSLPPPDELGEIFGPLSRAGNLSAWSTNPEEQDLFSRLQMDGAFPRLSGRDGLAVTIDNDGGGLIDPYASVSVDYADVPGAAGLITRRVTVVITNNAPSEGLPGSVIGNSRGLPPGTNRSLLSVYTALPVQSATLDGTPIGVQVGSLFDWNAATASVDIPPGATRTVILTVAGTLPSSEEVDVVTRVQPAASAWTVTGLIE